MGIADDRCVPPHAEIGEEGREEDGEANTGGGGSGGQITALLERLFFGLRLYRGRGAIVVVDGGGSLVGGRSGRGGL